jgi:hypothetical protein
MKNFLKILVTVVADLIGGFCFGQLAGSAMCDDE